MKSSFCELCYTCCAKFVLFKNMLFLYNIFCKRLEGWNLNLKKDWMKVLDLSLCKSVVCCYKVCGLPTQKFHLMLKVIWFDLIKAQEYVKWLAKTCMNLWCNLYIPYHIYFLLLIFFTLHFSILSIISLLFLRLFVFNTVNIFKIKVFLNCFQNLNMTIHRLSCVWSHLINICVNKID